MTDLRPHLRVVNPVRAPALECASPGCALPADRGAFGLCDACERVYRCALVLCDRLLDRDLARVEHESPGITAAVRVALNGTLDDIAVGEVERLAVLPGEPWAALLPMPDDLESLNDLLSEFEAALRVLGVIA